MLASFFCGLMSLACIALFLDGSDPQSSLSCAVLFLILGVYKYVKN